MQFHPNELFLLYNPHTSKGKQTKAIACSINSHINEVDTSCEKLGPTYWKEVLNLLGVAPKDLLDESHPDYKAKVAGNTYTMNGWLDVVMHNPQFLKAPIAIFNKKAVLCLIPTDIFKLSMREQNEKALPHLRKG
jgi:arsenate reductase